MRVDRRGGEGVCEGVEVRVGRRGGEGVEVRVCEGYGVRKCEVRVCGVKVCRLVWKV